MTEHKINNVRRGRQLSVFIENTPGTTARLCALLGGNGINIMAMTITGGVDHGYVRMVVDDHRQAREILEREHYLQFEREVVLLDLPNRPGSLGEVTAAWAAGGINLDYLYCAAGSTESRGLVVLKVDDTERALELLGAGCGE